MSFFSFPAYSTGPARLAAAKGQDSGNLFSGCRQLPATGFFAQCRAWIAVVCKISRRANVSGKATSVVSVSADGRKDGT
jgi:hypothetical protein